MCLPAIDTVLSQKFKFYFPGTIPVSISETQTNVSDIFKKRNVHPIHFYYMYKK